MINSITFGYSTTIKERHQLLEKVLPDDHTLHHLKQWRERRSLLSDEEFNLSLEKQGLSKLAFNRGVTPLNDSNLKVLFHHVQQQDWYQLHQQLFSNELDCTYSSETALRFHLDYFQKELEQTLKEYPTILLNQSAIDAIIDGVRKDLMLLAEKTLIWDVHDIIERNAIVADTPENAFRLYITQRLAKSENAQQFFSEYPTLSKLLSIRLKFFINNLNLFISSLVHESNQIQTVFKINTPFEITELKLGEGDSHNNGKSVLQFKLNQLPLIYKYKNLQIGERFNEFLSFIEELDSQYNFYQVKRVIGPNFTIEEEITQSTCHTKSDIKLYYFNYGSLLAITHWLGASDLHMENLIAHKQFPVLIDIETIILTDKTKKSLTLLTKQQLIERKSMISSGLLPLKRYWKRQLEMSALNGNKQKFPFKVRKLVNKNTSDVKLQLGEDYMEGAKNIPLLNNLEVNYQDYTTYIESGFTKMNALLLEHKQEILKTVQRLFHDCTVRHLLRDTQDYANFLSFAHHPSCMVNFIEREKIMENLWEAQFIAKETIPLEISEMLVNDIPLFESNSNEHWLQNTNGRLIDSLEKSSIELLSERIDNMTEDVLFDSLLFLRESLGTLTYELEEINIPAVNQDIDNLHLQKAADIGDLIVSNLKIDLQNEFVYWAESMPNEESDITLEYPSTNLYNGTAGVFIFLFSLNHFVPKPSYQKVLAILEKELFSDNLAKEDHFSAFYGDGASLTAAFYAYQLNHDKKYLERVHFYIERLAAKKIDEERYLDEWIYGKASLLALLVSIYHSLALPKVEMLIKKIGKEIDSTQPDNISFAHGLAGIIYSLNQVQIVVSDTTISKKRERLVSKFIQLLDLNKHSLNTSWCKGTIGINYTLDSLYLDSLLILNKQGYDSSICHGDYLNFEKVVRFNVNHKSLVNGLFNGLAGIGYFQLFQYYPNSISNILILEK